MSSALERIVKSKPYLSDEEFTISDLMSQCPGTSKGGISSAMVNGIKNGLFVVRVGKRGACRVNVYKRKKHNTAWFKAPLVTEPSPEDEYPKWKYAS
jgi:hypothetical protein